MVKSNDTDTEKKLPEIGQKIIRILTLRKDRKIAIIEKVRYQQTQRNNFTFRAVNSELLPFLKVKSTEDKIWFSMPNPNIGCVCFCTENIKRDTIAFEVIGYSNNKNAVFTKQISGKFSELLQYYDFPFDDSEIVVTEL